MKGKPDMFEKMNVPLPDINAYLTRIGTEEKEAPTPGFLDRIIHAHQTHIPYEDLDPWYFHKMPSLDIPDLFGKLVTGNRGGYCFEQNLLLAQALRDLGFDVYTCFCRISPPGDPEIWPSLHAASIVRFEDGLRFCDVGFGGPQPPASVPVNSTSVTEIYGEEWLIKPFDDQWYSLNRKGSSGTWEETMQFSLFRQTLCECTTLNYYCATFPGTLFSQSLVVGLRTENGSKNIMDSIFTKRENDECTRIELASWDETVKILREEFGIII